MVGSTHRDHCSDRHGKRLTTINNAQPESRIDPARALEARGILN